VIGRNTQGVKVMNLDPGDTVVDVARVVNEDAESEVTVVSEGRDQRELDV
jgi:DNA gyrase/topoisomerase IV subunit A